MNIMSKPRLVAEYLIETPLSVGKVAATMAGEQSCGTFRRVAGETDELRQRAAAEILKIELLDTSENASLTSQYLQNQGFNNQYQKARITIAFPLSNIGNNLTIVAATVGGNLFDLGEVTGIRLEAVHFPAELRYKFALPVHGIDGSREILQVHDRPLFGTIIKPNLGMSPEQTATLVQTLCEAGADFIKDDEVCGSPDHAPLQQRIKAVMGRVRRYRQRSGRNVMIAFNISDETEAMLRHADLVKSEGGNCVMVSLNWCGLAAIQTLRKSTNLVIHGHRNGHGALSRHPLLGFGYQAYQSLYRLTGIDHLHVHGIGGKFCNADEEVTHSARHCIEPLADAADKADRVLPVFSSGQWAGTIGITREAAQSSDFLFLAGGGILAHPSGPEAGVASLIQGWEATNSNIALEEYSKNNRELSEALEFFG